MKTPLPSVLVLCLGLWFSLHAADEKAAAKPAPEVKMKRVGVEEFAKLRANTNNLVLDVRTEKEFKAGHIPGAMNMDVNAPDFEAKAGQLDKSKTYLVHCVVGHRSEMACGRLAKAGFTNVYDFSAGLKGWQEAGQPVEK